MSAVPLKQSQHKLQCRVCKHLSPKWTAGSDWLKYKREVKHIYKPTSSCAILGIIAASPERFFKDTFI